MRHAEECHPTIPRQGHVRTARTIDQGNAEEPKIKAQTKQKKEKVGLGAAVLEKDKQTNRENQSADNGGWDREQIEKIRLGVKNLEHWSEWKGRPGRSSDDLPNKREQVEIRAFLRPLESPRFSQE